MAESNPRGESCLPLGANLPYLRHIVTITNTLPLDVNDYALDGEEARFFKAQTGITDNEDLKRHILQIQEEAYKACWLTIQVRYRRD